jgi:hypothetical protein
MNNIYAKEAVDPEGEGYGFDNPFLRMVLELADGSKELVVGGILDEEKGERYVRTSEGYTYVISKYTLKEIDIDMSKFFINNPLRIDKDKIQSIDIKTGKKIIKIDKEAIDKNVSYINKLKQFSVKKILFEEKYASGLRPPVDYSLKITKKDGKIHTLKVKKDKGEEFIAQWGEKKGVFLIDKSVFKKIFEDLDKLNLTEAASQK